MIRLIVLAVALTPAVASAHIALTSPKVRTNDQKVGPCGVAGSVRGTPTVMEPGAQLEVRWTEPINHPSHYRISFDVDGQDFTLPADYMDFSKTENVLADNIPDGAAPFTRRVQLPDVECDNCTLQLTQMMYDKQPYGDGNDLYFQCADITLRRGAANDPGDDPGQTDDPDQISGGCSASGSSTQALWIMAVVVPLAARRRRRP